MKTRLLFLSLCSILVACTSNNTSEVAEEIHSPVEQEVLTGTFNAEKAKAYGADKYGMKGYVMAFLKSGPNRPEDSTQAAKLQAAHMANIGRLAEEGKLVLAGPFYGEIAAELRGIYIFNTSSLDSARAYTATDPAIQYGSLIMELKQWYGSAALMGLNEAHNEIAELNI
jgi:uncharacterized protein YciI